MNPVKARAERKLYDLTGLAVWAVALTVVLAVATMAPEKRSVVVAYRWGAEQFLARGPLYSSQVAMGYLYPPAFAVLYAPFLKLGPYLGDLLWRIVGCAALTFAVIRQARIVDRSDWRWLASMALLLATPLALGAVRNGQSTTLLAGACWLLTISALEGRRAQVFLWAFVALFAKPTGIVAVLLVAALRPRLIPFLALAVLILLALPYLFAPVGYVNQTYRDLIALMQTMSLDESAAFTPSDFTAPFAALGVPIGGATALVVRVACALVALAATLWTDRFERPHLAGLVIFLIAAFYMCVFSPRNEGNSFIMMAVPCGLAVAYLWRAGASPALRMSLAVALFVSGLTGITPAITHALEHWFRPVVLTAILLPVLWWYWQPARTRGDGDRADLPADA